jgi:hypothetical protein
VKYKIDKSISQINALTKAQWKNLVNKNIKDYAYREYVEQGKSLTKLHELSKHKHTIDVEEYITKLPYNEAILLFKLRTRMLPLKCNQKASHSNLICKCGNGLEDETHIIEGCNLVSEPSGVKYQDAFSTDMNKQRQVTLKCLNFLEL